MPLNLAHHLRLSRCGIFYFRMAVPAALRPSIGKREIVQSLKTRNPATARKLAYYFASQTYVLFQKMTYPPIKFNLPDGSTLSTEDTGSFRPYELDLLNFKGKTDGTPEDHDRMMEAITVCTSNNVRLSE